MHMNTFLGYLLKNPFFKFIYKNGLNCKLLNEIGGSYVRGKIRKVLPCGSTFPCVHQKRVHIGEFYSK